MVLIILDNLRFLENVSLGFLRDNTKFVVITDLFRGLVSQYRMNNEKKEHCFHAVITKPKWHTILIVCATVAPSNGVLKNCTGINNMSIADF